MSEQDDSALEALADRIERLSPPDILRMAADLLDARRPHEALILIDKISGEMHLALLGLTRAKPKEAPK